MTSPQPTASLRRLITGDPFPESRSEDPPWAGRGFWPCWWVGCPEVHAPSAVAFRRKFELSEAATVRVHVTADERYELFLDGRRVGRGSERGDLSHWFFETYDLPLSAGPHVLVAKVWWLGGLAPVAQLSLSPGFLLAAEEKAFLPILGTGVAAWEWKKLDGLEFVACPQAEGSGAKILVDGSRFPWDFAFGGGVDWKPVDRLQAGASALRCNDYAGVHLLIPATLPPMRESVWSHGKIRLIAKCSSFLTSDLPVKSVDHLATEAGHWESLLTAQGGVVIPPHTCRRVLIDLEDYVCAYPELTTSGGVGGEVRILWAEALIEKPDGTKGNRDEVEGKFFEGIGDTFRPDGGTDRAFSTLWWEAGRYVEIVVQTSEQALTLERLTLFETRYPLAMESRFEASDPRLDRIVPILLRSLQMCMHETYMDCPYYEQMMYTGDTRTAILTSLTLTRDSRLARKSLGLFASSRLASGLTQSRYPSRVTQIIPPFSLWWAGMVHDYALWRGDAGLVKTLMPVVRNVMDLHIDDINSDGLLNSQTGWNFIDWVDGWNYGVPPHEENVSGVLNLQFLLILTLVEKLEVYCGRPELAAQYRRVAHELSSRIDDAFWKEERGLYSDDPSGKSFSEHAQCLALLSGLIGKKEISRLKDGLLGAPDLARTSIYFSHYLFEAYALLGNAKALFSRLEFWSGLETNGFKTTPETAGHTRSDCHVWGAHPLHHYFATILGIRPRAMGFESVEIRPLLGPLRHVKGALAHPLGEIAVAFERDAGSIMGSIVLPAGLSGYFVVGDQITPLREGRQSVKAAEDGK